MTFLALVTLKKGFGRLLAWVPTSAITTAFLGLAVSEGLVVDQGRGAREASVKVGVTCGRPEDVGQESLV